MVHETSGGCTNSGIRRIALTIRASRFSGCRAKKEPVKRIPQTDPRNDEEDSVAEQVLPELGDVRLEGPRGKQQPDDEQDRPATQ
jgi:hypothetical protein